jgi:hypothetical protein
LEVNDVVLLGLEHVGTSLSLVCDVNALVDLLEGEIEIVEVCRRHPLRLLGLDMSVVDERERKRV